MLSIANAEQREVFLKHPFMCGVDGGAVDAKEIVLSCTGTIDMISPLPK